MKPTISLIVPCYNVQDHVQPALQSILDNISATDHARLQVLIVNDGSTDQTLEKIEQFIAEKWYSTIRHHIITQENAGLSAARNAGMAQATGDYWLFLDSDDIFINQALDKIIAAICSTRARHH